MLYKLLSHVDFNGEIMPRKLMEPAPGTTTLVIYPPLCTSKQKHMSGKWAFANQRERSNCQVVWQASSLRVTFILKGSLPYMAARAFHWKAESLTRAGMCLCAEYFPVLLFTFQRDPWRQGPFEDLSVKELFCLFLLDCLFPVKELVQNMQQEDSSICCENQLLWHLVITLLAIWVCGPKKLFRHSYAYSSSLQMGLHAPTILGGQEDAEKRWCLLCGGLA